MAISMTDKAEPKTLPFILKSLLAGGLAGSAAKTIIGPFDRVKILFQASHPQVRHHSGRISGVFAAVNDIYKQSGIFGLYRGHSAMLLRIFPYAAIQYMAFEEYKTMLQDYLDPPLRRLVSGSLAGATAVFFTYPFDIVRARLAYQIHLHEHSRLSGILKQMAKERKYPWLAFYQGFGPSLLGIVPYAGVAFFTFETLKNFCMKFAVLSGQDGEIGGITKFCCGFVAGAAGQTAAYPFDVIRRRMQLFYVANHLPKYQHTLHGIKEILFRDGLRGLFIGLSINYIKVAPATGISFVTYEFLKRKLGI